jgi:ribosome-associated protein
VLRRLFSEPAWSHPLTPSPAPDAQDHPVQNDAVSNTAHEMDPIELLHAEDGDDSSDEDLSDPSAADFPLFGADAEDADDVSNFDRQGLVPTGSNPLETALLSKLDEDKAQDIVLIDLKGKSPMADTMIVASGRSHRHVGALADHLLRTLKEQGLGRAKVEGLPHCDWVLIDAGDVIVHLFRPEVRMFYNIEKIWAVDSAHRTANA